MMSRPRRSAAQRAKDLIARGFGVKEVDQWNAEGLSPEEEDLLDEQLTDPEKFCKEECEQQEQDRGEVLEQTSKTYFSFGDEDVDVSGLEFKPKRPVGLHLLEHATRHGVTKLCRAIDFFMLFFTPEIMQELCENTNTYGWMHILEKPTYARYNDGSWDPISVLEMYAFIGIVILMGFQELKEIPKYWSVTEPYIGTYASRFMSRTRFKAILGLVHVSNPDEENPADKLSKLHPLLKHIKTVCRRLYQPGRNVAVDERMVKSKGRSGIKQYMPQKPVRFGYKLWCVCESRTGYTLDFNVYTGKREHPSPNGLAYDVVMTLMADYWMQGYKLWIDSFYTSMFLLQHLFSKGVMACGTSLVTRKGFPKVLNDKKWEKASKRGDMRYVRKENVLFMRWKDTKPVTVCSTIHKGNTSRLVKRNVKDPKGNNRIVYVKKPSAICDYNMHMGAVDLSNQLIQPYNVLIKSQRWWKTLFFHLIDIAIVNSFLLMKEWRLLHPNEPGLQRLAGYSQLSFREELVTQLAALRHIEVPALRCLSAAPMCEVYHSAHIPEPLDNRKNCKLCYIIHGKEHKTKWICSNPNCNVALCMQKDRHCMKLWHSPAFDKNRSAVLEQCRRK